MSRKRLTRLASIADRVTALPTGLTADDDGMEVNFLADAANGIVWRLKYRAASSSAYKWEVIGGSALLAFVATVETTASSGYVALATAGPSVTVPLAGDYEVQTGYRGGSDTLNGGAAHSFDVGATAALDADLAQAGFIAQEQTNVSTRRKKLALAAATALVSKYRRANGTGTATFADRYMRVMPVRVG